MKYVSNESTLYSCSRNIVKFRTVLEIRGDVARLCLENGNSYDKSHKHPWPSTIRCNALNLKAKAGARAPEVYRKTLEWGFGWRG